MKRFEAGKRYDVNGGGIVKIEKRTPCYVTISGSFSGRFYVGRQNGPGIFGLGECFWIPSPKCKSLSYPVFAAHETEEEA